MRRALRAQSWVRKRTKKNRVSGNETSKSSSLQHIVCLAFWSSTLQHIQEVSVQHLDHQYYITSEHHGYPNDQKCLSVIWNITTLQYIRAPWIYMLQPVSIATKLPSCTNINSWQWCYTPCRSMDEAQKHKSTECIRLFTWEHTQKLAVTAREIARGKWSTVLVFVLNIAWLVLTCILKI